MEPRQPLFGESMALGRVRLGVVEGAHVKVDFGRPALAFVGERRAAGGAEAAMDTGRGSEACEGALGEAHIGALEPCVGRDRRAGVAAATRAMAVARPFGRALGREADGAAVAA